MIYYWGMREIDEKEIARAFWNRVDIMRGKTQLNELAALCGMSFTTLRNQKSGSRQQLPKTLHAYSIANALKTTVEFLLTGDTGSDFSSKLYHAYLKHPHVIDVRVP